MEFSGLLVGAALAGIMILIFSVGMMTMKSQGIGLYRAEEYKLYCVFDQGLGLRIGTKVLVKGVEVGRVSELALTEDSRVQLTFEVKKQFSPWIVDSSQVYATRDQNLIAERIINIVPPLNKSKLHHELPEGSTLIAGDAQDIETVIQKAVALLSTADTLAQKTNVILSNALDPKSTLGALIMSRELYDQLLYQVDKVDQITSHTERMIGNVEMRLPPLLDRTDSLIGQVGRVGVKLDTISTQAMGLLHSVDTTLYATNQIMGDLRILSRGATQMLMDGDAKIEKADNLMTGLSSFWFIKNRIPKTDSVPLLGDEKW